MRHALVLLCRHALRGIFYATYFWFLPKLFVCFVFNCASRGWKNLGGIKLCRGLQVCFMPLDGQEVRASPAGHALNPQESACVRPHPAYLQILCIFTGPVSPTFNRFCRPCGKYVGYCYVSVVQALVESR